MGPIGGLDAVTKKNLWPNLKLNSDSSFSQCPNYMLNELQTDFNKLIPILLRYPYK
jgi:hypothetical protein